MEDRLALGGDVGSLFLYSYMQKVLDSLFAIASTVSDAVVTTDKMDAFQDPSFAASALSIAWLAAALPMGGFDFRASRSGVSKALVTVARSGGGALALVVAALYARAAATHTPPCPQDFSFAAGILPVIGAWRYVLAETADL